MITKLNKQVFYIIITVVFLISCSEDTGSFAFKKYNDDRFININGIAEFSSDQKVEWTFCFKKVSKQKKIGIVILKKETVWVDVYSFYETINKDKPCIFGSIENYQEGNYKIVILDSDNEIAKEIAAKMFIIYNDETDDK